MRVNYEVSGQERKSLVAAISQALNAETKYLGMPTANYEVGGYTITKTGEVIGEDNRELVEKLKEQGFTAVSEGYDAPAKPKGIMDCLVEALNENAEEGEHWERLHRTPTIIDDSGREHNLDGTFAAKTEYGEVAKPEKKELPSLYTLDTPRGEIYIAEEFENHAQAAAEGYGEYFTTALGTVYSYNDDHTFALVTSKKSGDWDKTKIKQDFRKMANESDEVSEPTFATGESSSDTEGDTFTVEIPKNGSLSDERMQNLLKLAESKRSLLTKALGTPLEINDAGDTVQFIFPYSEDVGIGQIYGQLAATMVKYVKKHQRVTATEREVESEKFAMRTFLVKLGMNGLEYSAARKWFCRNLSGNASFSKDEKYAAMQESRRNDKEEQSDEQQ